MSSSDLAALRQGFSPVLLVLLLFLGCLSLHAEDFTVVLLPDTQNYSEFYPQIFQSQTQWVAENAATKNIKIVLGLGDIVNHGSSVTEWQNADAAIRLLDGKVPYLLAIGNHDYEGANPSKRLATTFNSYFGPQRYAGLPWYSANLNGSNENFYGTFEADGKTYLVLVLEYVPRTASLDWAASVAQANPEKEIIVVTHAYMYKDDTRTDACDTNDMPADNDGDETWNKFVSKYPNIIMVVSGHITSGSAGHRSDLGVNGNLVNQMLSNYQTWPNGGNGYLRILDFHPLQNTIDVATYSPYLNQFSSDAKQHFTLSYHNPGFATGSGTLAGRVREARHGSSTDCKPVFGVTVTAGTQSAVTDASGNYSLTLTPDTYGSTTSGTGWKSSTLSAMVHDGYTSDLEFFLTPTCTLSTINPSVTICTPANGASVISPVHVMAEATDSHTVTSLQAYVDGALRFTSKTNSLDTSLAMPDGTHKLTVQGKDSAGAVFKQTISITVISTVSLTPSSADFGSQAVGTVSSPKAFTLTNQGSTALQVTEVSTTGDFTVDDGCETTLAVGASCSISVAFTPSAPGTRTGSLVVTDSGAGSPHSSALTGAGGSAAVCAPGSASPSVTICTPQNGATVTSPVHITAAAESSNPVTLMQIYIDGVKAWQNSGSTVDTNLTLAAGTRRLTVQAKDSTGFTFKQTINITAQ